MSIAVLLRSCTQQKYHLLTQYHLQHFADLLEVYPDTAQCWHHTKILCKLIKVLKVFRMCLQPCGIFCIFHSHKARQHDCQQKITPWAYLQMQRRLLGDGCGYRIDDDHSLAFDKWHDVGIGHSEIAPPDYHDIRFGNLLWRKLTVVSSARQYPCLSSTITETAVGACTTQLLYQQIGHALHDSQIARATPLQQLTLRECHRGSV